MHSIMKRSETQSWEQLEMDVLHCDVWPCIHGDEPGCTFRSTQYTSTWSRLDRIYIMHTDSFLPDILDISISHDLVLSDHFPLVFDFAHQLVDQLKYFLRQSPLRFNSSF